VTSIVVDFIDLVESSFFEISFELISLSLITLLTGLAVVNMSSVVLTFVLQLDELGEVLPSNLTRLELVVF
jgi:predicted membrane-bound spermidine synthase